MNGGVSDGEMDPGAEYLLVVLGGLMGRSYDGSRELGKEDEWWVHVNESLWIVRSETS